MLGDNKGEILVQKGNGFGLLFTQIHILFLPKRGVLASILGEQIPLCVL